MILAKPKTSILQKIALALFSFILFIIILEIALRLGGFIYLALQEHRNRVSFKQRDEFGILTLGYSMTAGGEDPYLGQLEDVLNQRSTGVKFSMIK